MQPERSTTRVRTPTPSLPRSRLLPQPLHKFHDRLKNPLASHVEEIVVVGAVDPERGDRPAGFRGQRFAHLERDDAVPPAVTDQGWTGDLGDLVNVVESVAQQQRNGHKRQQRRPISTPLVNDEKAIRPPTFR